MKKILLLFGIGGLFILFAFNLKSDEKTALSAQSTDVIYTTLNGIPLHEAEAIVSYCNKTKDNKPLNTQIWFKKEVIDSLVSLLRFEQKEPNVADGIRIYFSRTQATVDTPIHSNNGIVVVSTYAKDTIINGKDTTIHKDYFGHLKSLGLFNMGAVIRGEITHFSDTTQGALLYAASDDMSVNPCIIRTDHEISRNKASNMVYRFGRNFFLHRSIINSKAEWFDIGLIETLAKEMDLEDDDGVRIYFARGVDANNNKFKSKFIIQATESVTDPVTQKVIHKDNFKCPNPPPPPKTLRSHSEDNGELCPTNCYGVTLPTS